MTTSYSTKELMACVIARDLKDGEDLQVGFGRDCGRECHRDGNQYD